eukprot:RCo010884
MLYPEGYSRIVYAGLLKKIQNPASAVDVTCADFDGVSWHLKASSASSTCLISLKFGLIGIEFLVLRGLKEMLSASFRFFLSLKAFPEACEVETEEHYDLSVVVELLNAPESLAMKFAELARACLSTPFMFIFDRYEKELESCSFEVRKGELLEICSGKDNVMVKMKLLFDSDTSMLLARILLQEFVDARKQDKSLNAAPGFSWRQESSPNTLSCEFALFRSHICKENAVKTVDRLLSFRTYLHYHIKCSVSQLHSRIRTRVDENIKILNRAKTHATGQVSDSIK